MIWQQNATKHNPPEGIESKSAFRQLLYHFTRKSIYTPVSPSYLKRGTILTTASIQTLILLTPTLTSNPIPSPSHLTGTPHPRTLTLNYHLINLKRRKVSNEVYGHSVYPTWLRDWHWDDSLSRYDFVRTTFHSVEFVLVRLWVTAKIIKLFDW